MNSQTQTWLGFAGLFGIVLLVFGLGMLLGYHLASSPLEKLVPTDAQLAVALAGREHLTFYESIAREKKEAEEKGAEGLLKQPTVTVRKAVHRPVTRSSTVKKVSVKTPQPAVRKHPEKQKKQDLSEKRVTYKIQVAAFRMYKKAKQLKRKLLKQQFGLVEIRKNKRKRGKFWYKVQVLHLSPRSKAEQIFQKVKRFTGLQPLMLKEN